MAEFRLGLDDLEIISLMDRITEAQRMGGPMIIRIPGGQTTTSSLTIVYSHIDLHIREIRMAQPEDN